VTQRTHGPSGWLAGVPTSPLSAADTAAEIPIAATPQTTARAIAPILSSWARVDRGTLKPSFSGCRTGPSSAAGESQQSVVPLGITWCAMACLT
jgi:hypothetical protein